MSALLGVIFRGNAAGRGVTSRSGTNSGSPLVPIDLALRRIRLLTAAVLLIRLAGGRNGSTILGLEPAVLSGSIAGSLVFVNLLSRWMERASRQWVAFLLSVLVLATDATLTVGIVAKLDLIDADVVWALLVIPVLEGALRFRMRGALFTWIGCTGLYFLATVGPVAAGTDLATQAAFLDVMQTLVHRAGVILLVAVPGGYLSEQLLVAIAGQRSARLDATRRGQLMERVVEAGRALHRLEGTDRVDVTRYVLALGFDVADVCRLDAGQWSVAEFSTGSHNLRLPDPSSAYASPTAPLAAGGALVVGGEDEDVETRRQLRAAGLGLVVLCPLPGREGTNAVLRAATRAGTRPSAQEVESLELLAAQTVVAGENHALVGELQDAQSRLAYQAYHDALTELPNRAMFQRVLSDAVHGASAESQIALLFLDLDHFKEVNDTLGHKVGDELLVAVSGRLRNCAAEAAVIARLGGDEFTVLLVGTPDESVPSELAAAIRDVMSQPFNINGHTVGVSTSIGIAMAGSPIEPNELMRRADLAMYRAKSLGRSTYAVYGPELDDTTSDRLRLQVALQAAVTAEALNVLYQPIVDAASGRITGVEALLRWFDEDLGQVPPDEFIGVAEDSGLICDLGAWVLQRACAQGRHWFEQYPDSGLTVSVNISPLQLARPGFPEFVASVLRESGFPANRLILELTERMLVADEVRAALPALRAMGVRLAVDDFGQGHTSVAALRNLSLDVLKIDRAFVTGVDYRPQQHAILRSMVSLAHNLEMVVVAEGVQTEGELAQLQHLSCDWLQGYLLHRPMEAAAVSLLLDDVAGATASPALSGMTEA